MNRSLAGLLVVALGACGGSEGPALAPGAVKAFEKPFYNSIAETYSLDIVDLAREGDLVVMTMLYGWTTFFEHSAGCAEFCSPNGSSAQNGGYYVSVSRDGGATFTSSPLLAAAGVGGEPYGVQLHGGRAWILLGRANGIGTQLELHMHPLDLTTFTIGEALPGQDFFTARGVQFAFSGPTVTAHISRAGDLDRLDGYFGFQALDLVTGAFTGHVSTVRFDGCESPLYSADDGATWTGYGPCTVPPDQTMCRFDSARGQDGIPARTCVLRLRWPGPYEAPYDQLGVAETEGGVVAVYHRDGMGDGMAYAARIDGDRVVEIALGPVDASDLAGAGRLRPFPYVRLPFASLIPVGDHFVSLSSAGVAEAVHLPRTPCARDADCVDSRTAITRVLPLGGDDYLAAYLMDVGGPDQIVMAIHVRRVTAPKVAIDAGPAPASPIPGCPTAVPASPLVTACARAVACYPQLDIRACLDDWALTAHGPTAAALDKFLATTSCDGYYASYAKIGLGYLPTCTPGCIGDVAVVACSTDSRPHYVVDCAAQGTTCGASASGVGCYGAGSTDCNTCDGAGGAVSCYGTTPLVTDCTSFGQTCSTASGAATCLDARATCDGKSVCEDGKQIGCGAVVDCAALGLPCTPDGSRGGYCGTCEGNGCGDRLACPAQTGCYDRYMLVEFRGGVEHAWVDCAAIGYRTCTDLGLGHPICVL